MSDPDRTTSRSHAEDAFTAAAELLATDPDAIRRARAAHHRTPDGRCAACGPISRWPCAVATIAHRAVGIARRGRTGPA